ncbi:hypothetical protein B0H13DRAFT_2097544 [Mycena leptocephala]|nr:hypothetical protein B0H13DRAFT_2097544 [Mycena leptocephala]
MSVRESTVTEFYAIFKSQLYTAAASLFFSGICLLLFSLAVYFLLKMRTPASRMFLALAVILVLFALSQAFLDVALAVVFSQLMQGRFDNDPPTQLLSIEQNWVRIFTAREALIAINNAITDCLLLYRCAAIWASSPYARIVIAVPSLLILSTLVAGLYGTFGISGAGTPIPYSLALVTNFVLLALTAGRIWRKGRQATVVLGVEAGRRYNKTLEIICESSLLYFIGVLIYLITSLTQEPTAPLTNLAWGSIAQVVNIVPMMIIVRVGMARNSGEQENSHTFYGGSGGRFGMTPISDVTTPLKGSGQYSRV